MILQVRRSAFADLAEAREVVLGKAPGDSTFTIRGSETGEAYEAVFVVVRDRLVRRRVASTVFRDEAWEETRYSYTEGN